MNSKTKDILLIICTVLLVFSIFLIYQLDSRLQNLNDQIVIQYNNLSSLSSEINGISANVDAALEKQASILDSYDYTVGTIDEKDLTIPVTFRIVPKEHSATTTAVLWAGDKSYDMYLNGNTFTVTASIPLLNDGYVFTAAFTDGDVTRMETLDIYSDFLREVIPGGFINFAGSVSSDMKDNTCTLNFNSSVWMDLYSYSSENPITSAKLCVSAENKRIYEKELSVEDIINATEFDMKETLEIPANEECLLYIELTDSYGLHYRFIAYSIEVDEEGNPKESAEAAAQSMNIYDSTGKLLFENY